MIAAKEADILSPEKPSEIPKEGLNSGADTKVSLDIEEELAQLEEELQSGDKKVTTLYQGGQPKESPPRAEETTIIYEGIEGEFSKDNPLHFDFVEVGLDHPKLNDILELSMKFLRKLASQCAGEEDAVQLCAEQGTDEWFELRKDRVTASQVGRILKRKKIDPPESMTKFVQKMLNPMKYMGEIEALTYGREKEAVAVQKYLKENPQMQFKTTGLWTSKRAPWLGASPDGIVFDKESCKEGLLEIKCPFRAKEYTLDQLVAKGSFFLAKRSELEEAEKKEIKKIEKKLEKEAKAAAKKRATKKAPKKTSKKGQGKTPLIAEIEEVEVTEVTPIEVDPPTTPPPSTLSSLRASSPLSFPLSPTHPYLTLSPSSEALPQTQLALYLLSSPYLDFYLYMEGGERAYRQRVDRLEGFEGMLERVHEVFFRYMLGGGVQRMKQGEGQGGVEGVGRVVEEEGGEIEGGKTQGKAGLKVVEVEGEGEGEIEVEDDKAKTKIVVEEEDKEVQVKKGPKRLVWRYLFFSKEVYDKYFNMNILREKGICT